MSYIRIEAFPGEYSNDDAYVNVLKYLSKKAYLGGFGYSPNLPVSIAEQFQLSELCSKADSQQKVWHFCICFSQSWDHTALLKMAVWIASTFSEKYQVMYALDLERNGKPAIPHLHFCVNAFSYHPDLPPLSKELMKQHLEMIQQELSAQYYPYFVTLQFQGKRKRRT